jgi:16S rRNA A1518/A1519 N6-dimethyltransferase RsmA/KsgA/DIM1 with predicted DNA glycosylase/AP lyase activity
VNCVQFPSVSLSQCIFAAVHDNSGGWFLEIGSDYGAMTLAVADHFDGVVAIEANADNVIRLAANIAWNANIGSTIGIVPG